MLSLARVTVEVGKEVTRRVSESDVSHTAFCVIDNVVLVN